MGGEPIISGEHCKIHAAHLMYNDVGRLVCIGCLIWSEEREWPYKMQQLELQIEGLRMHVRALLNPKRGDVDAAVAASHEK